MEPVQFLLATECFVLHTPPSEEFRNAGALTHLRPQSIADLREVHTRLGQCELIEEFIGRRPLKP